MPASTPLDLSGYFLANNYDTNLTQWAFPSGSEHRAGRIQNHLGRRRSGRDSWQRVAHELSAQQCDRQCRAGANRRWPAANYRLPDLREPWAGAVLRRLAGWTAVLAPNFSERHSRRDQLRPHRQRVHQRMDGEQYGYIARSQRSRLSTIGLSYITRARSQSIWAAIGWRIMSRIQTAAFKFRPTGLM